MTNPTTTAARERPIILHAREIRALLAGQLTQVRRPVMPQPDGHFKSFGKLPTCECHPFGFDDNVRHWACPFGAPGTVLWARETYVTGHDADDSGHLITEDAEGKELPEKVWYRASEPSFRWLDGDGCDEGNVPWKSPATMPRSASRLTIELTAARVERVQAITEADAVASGLEVRMGDGMGPGPGFKWDGPAYWDGFSTCPTWGKTYHAPTRGGPCCCHVGQREGLSAARCAYRHLWDRIHGKRPGCDWNADPWVWCGTFRKVEVKS